MKIVTVGRGTIGGGLAALWRAAGHDVEEFGRDGGNASSADVVLVAVPGARISDALRKVGGLDGKLAIDATNILPSRQGNFSSYAEEVQSFTHAPVAKGFNMNFGHLLPVVRNQRARPSNLYVGDDGAVEVVEQLMRDAGYDPVRVGTLRGHVTSRTRSGCSWASNRSEASSTGSPSPASSDPPPCGAGGYDHLTSHLPGPQHSHTPARSSA